MRPNLLTLESVAKAALDLLPEFERKCGHVPNTCSSILPSEMLCFMGVCRQAGIEKIVESGRDYGYSTECLALMGFDVISYEIRPRHDVDARLAKYSNLDLQTGPCPVVISARPKFGLLLDGPKGFVALQLVESSNPTVVGIHDMTGTNPARAKVDMMQWVTTDRLNPCESLDRDHLLPRGLERSVLSEAFVLALAQFLDLNM